MILKKIQTQQLNDNNRPSSILEIEEGLSPVTIFMLRKKAEGLLSGVFISDALIAEIDGFIKRNNVAKPIEEMHTSCPRCLKAHAVKRANELGADLKTIRHISKIFDGEVGHEGYYMDADELVRL